MPTDHAIPAGKPAKYAGLTSCPSYRPLGQKLKSLPYTVAATSFVIPDTVAANCQYLQGFFPEIGLCLFETKGCLAYTKADVPPRPIPGLRFHAHLPMDLPWDKGPKAAAQAALAVLAKVDHLQPRPFVLHPPATANELMEFVHVWEDQGLAPADLLLENIKDRDLRPHLPLVEDLGLGLCLDLGHMLSYEQQFLLQEAPWPRVAMLHIYAPEPTSTGYGSKHVSLGQLSPVGQELLGNMLCKLRQGSTITLEIFQEQGLLDSAKALVQWMTAWNLV